MDNRFIDLRKQEIQAIFKIRNVVIAAVHEYLRSQNFLEVHTPNIIASSSEGGTDVFKLKYFEKEVWSRRVSHEHRLVYVIYSKEHEVDIVSCKSHYEGMI